MKIPNIDNWLWELNLLRVKTSQGKKEIWKGFGKNGEDLIGKEYHKHFSNVLGTPKYDNGIDYICYDRGMTPMEALKWWGSMQTEYDFNNPKFPKGKSKVNKLFCKAREDHYKEQARIAKIQKKLEINKT